MSCKLAGVFNASIQNDVVDSLRKGSGAELVQGRACTPLAHHQHTLIVKGDSEQGAVFQ